MTGLEPDFVYPLENLTISQGRDATFTCVVSNLGGYRSAFLEVVIPPDIISEETSNDLMVPEGGSAKLVCKARGYPKPEIVWKREDGAEIISRAGLSGGKTKIATAEGETLTLSKVTRSEMGTYLCIASNGVPPSVSKRMMLHVHFHPMVQVPNQLVGAPTGTNVTLVCLVEASPKAINYWTRESGEMIISNHKYSMSELKTSVYSVQMRLVIMNLQKQDLGGYKCISKNSIGDAEGNIRLYDMDLPKHSKKPGDRRGDDDTNEAINDRDHRLNHVYQGSLRETGSTLEPFFDGDDVSSSTSSNDVLPPASCILLITFSHLLALT
ncbi:lachesin-like isoform X4 [Frieseomelitta varia]|uniref:lachesin-like isoform X4 n=1 Tax=Frieseomelitta varia TaxID=561572 RepID=UPI001CB6833D|nr:lachesin-like isoform X4 [Frieseomelitta varia]